MALLMRRQSTWIVVASSWHGLAIGGTTAYASLEDSREVPIAISLSCSFPAQIQTLVVACLHIPIHAYFPILRGRAALGKLCLESPCSGRPDQHFLANKPIDGST